MVASVKNWFSKFQKYLFYYKDGFYELPYLANSPQLMVESFRAMPFVKNYAKEGYYTISNMFVSGAGHYHEIEEGLWVIMSDFEVKKNLNFNLCYEYGIPADYHFLTLYLNRGTLTVKKPRINVNIDNIDRSWTLFKAGSKAQNTHFKGQKSIFLTIYFSQAWMEDNIASHGVLENTMLQQFFDSDEECLFLPYFLDEKRGIYEDLVESILNKDENGVRDPLMLKANTLNIIASFVAKLDDNRVNKVLVNLPDKDKRAVVRAQYMLNGAIFQSFPTIAAIAKEVGVSETKLKADFKRVYGMTLYQFYDQAQMKYARELLLKESLPVKEVAYTMGYASPGKFAAAFKKTYGVLPSEMK
jgi:AraC-like DNA-binding protein